MTKCQEKQYDLSLSKKLNILRMEQYISENATRKCCSLVKNIATSLIPNRDTILSTAKQNDNHESKCDGKTPQV